MHYPYFQNIPLPEQQSFSLRRFHRSASTKWTVKYHFHNMCELVIYESIVGSFFSNGEEYPVKRQHVLFIPPESIHGFEVGTGELIYHVAHFHPRVLASLQNTSQLTSHAILAEIDDQDFPLVLSLLKWIEQRLTVSDSDEQITSGLKLLLGIVSPLLSKAHGGSKKRSPNHFGPLVQFLNQSQQFNININDAADLCHMSRSHFMSKFKRTYGMTFNAFLEDRKISTAMQLLRSTDKSINQITDYIGVNSSAYFAKIFKKAVGCSPSYYRKKHANH